jgi:hypothetical protein
VYTGIPLLELQKDLSTLSLIASTLRQSSIGSIRRTPQDYPTYQLIWNRCSQLPLTLRAQQFFSTTDTAALRNHSNLHPRSVLDQFMVITLRHQLVHLLPQPPHTQRRGPKWDHKAFKTHINSLTFHRMALRMTLESRGYHHGSRGWNAGEPITHRRPQQPRGTYLPPQLGIHPLTMDIPTLTKAAFAHTPGPFPSLTNTPHTNDTQFHAKLRARIALNRSSLNAVRHQHNNDPTLIRHCEQCHLVPIPSETSHHTLTQCPRYGRARTRLRRQLHTEIADIQQQATNKPHLHHITQHPDVLLHHLITASPCILSLLATTKHRRILRTTGAFLEFIHRIRPV